MGTDHDHELEHDQCQQELEPATTFALGSLCQYQCGSSYRAPGPNKLMSRLSGPGKIGPQDLTGFPLPFF